MKRLLLITLVCISCFACGPKEEGVLNDETRSELQALVDNYHITPEDKYNRLAVRMAQLINEAYAKRTEEEMMDHLREFYQDNETALTALEKEIQDWMRSLSDAERANFVMRVNGREYANDLRRRRRQVLYRIRNSEEEKREFVRLFSILDMYR